MVTIVLDQHQARAFGIADRKRAGTGEEIVVRHFARGVMSVFSTGSVFTVHSN